MTTIAHYTRYNLDGHEASGRPGQPARVKRPALPSLSALLAAGTEPFTASNMHGRPIGPRESDRSALAALCAYSSQLPYVHQETAAQHIGTHGPITYIVWSYQTPIAWRYADGTWFVPDVKYSATTGRHQSWITGALIRPFWDANANPREVTYGGETWTDRGAYVFPDGQPLWAHARECNPETGRMRKVSRHRTLYPSA